MLASIALTCTETRWLCTDGAAATPARGQRTVETFLGPYLNTGHICYIDTNK